jgi:NAD(P)-dependent dehydrogenase (short-subunit alcohol dehydrogenase family)
MYDYSGKVVMVTGAAGNLGRVVARFFLEAGANAALVDRDQGRLKPLFDGLVPADCYHLVEGVDSSSFEAMEAAAAGVIERFGSLDILVHAIGGFKGGKPLSETSIDTYDSMLNSHPRTTFIACKAVIPHMLAQGSGKIVTMASRSALEGQARQSAYSAAKGAVLRLTESLSDEVKSSGINVNCILPGVIDTEENRRAMPDADHSRWVQPESLSSVILFLCSDDARDIHGAAVPVFGLSG